MTDLFGNEEIRALSWKQPYAEMMFHGKIETRTWKTSYRGKVLICAAKNSFSLLDINDTYGKKAYQWANGFFIAGHVNYDLLGYALGIGNLVDCRRMKLEDESKCFIEYKYDLYCHVYENVQRIEPFPWTGNQGWKILNDEQKERIKITA